MGSKHNLKYLEGPQGDIKEPFSYNLVAGPEDVPCFSRLAEVPNVACNMGSRTIFMLFCMVWFVCAQCFPQNVPTIQCVTVLALSPHVWNGLTDPLHSFLQLRGKFGLSALISRQGHNNRIHGPEECLSRRKQAEQAWNACRVGSIRGPCAGLGLADLLDCACLEG